MDYPLRFRAAILEKNNGGLKVDEVVFRGPLQTGQVLVKIDYSGICGKQLEEIEGTRPDPYMPHMLGHEGVGTVKDLGPGVTKVSIGDDVVLHWLRCKGINSTTPRYAFADDTKVNAGQITTFNEYGVISENRLTKIGRKDGSGLECLLGCCVTSGLGVILNQARPLPEDSVAIFGCGGVGLNAVQGAALMNAYPIIAVDSNPRSLELAREFGATHVVISDGNEDVSKRVKEIAAGHQRVVLDSKNWGLGELGAQYVVLAAANIEFMELGIRSASIPGKIFLVGVPSYNSVIRANAFDLHSSKDLIGSHGGECIPERDIPKYLRMHERGKLKLRELVGETVNLENINKGIEIMKRGGVGRCLVRM